MTSESAGNERDAGGAQTFAELMGEAMARLDSLEISCGSLLSGGRRSAASVAPVLTPRRSQLELLQVQVEQLKAQLARAVGRREEEDQAFKQAARFATSKGSANAVFHAFFGLMTNCKVTDLVKWLDTGVIPTRDGLNHCRMDLRELRNESGATLLHAAVDVSMKPQAVKVKLVHLLINRVRFDPNVRDVFGRTPLHIAAMSGYDQVVKALLEHGADPLAQDRSGMTVLSLVRSLSRPPEDIVQTLARAESVAARGISSMSAAIDPKQAIASALFLKSLSRFTRSEHTSNFSRQTASLVGALLRAKNNDTVSLDEYVRDHVSLLFGSSPACHVIQLDELFRTAMYRDPWFQDELKVEADGYGLSLVAPAPSTGAFAGSTWGGVLLKLVQCLKVVVGSPPPPAEPTEAQSAPDHSAISSSAIQISTVSVTSSGSTPTSALSVAYYADRMTFQPRQEWFYAVLFRASTRALPGTLTVKNGSEVAVASEDVAKYFPLEDSILIGAEEYFVKQYGTVTRELHLDRSYKGVDATGVKAYMSGTCSTILPPYIAVKRIWERDPGNKFEEHKNNEQELFQDYQFLDPESDYEVAVKLGPLPSAQTAKSIADEWKRLSKRQFDAHTCASGSEACAHYCPQREGHSLCSGTMATIGRELAKQHFGRPTLSKPMKPRASLQKLQDRFKGTDPWPGSPSAVPTSSVVPP